MANMEPRMTRASGTAWCENSLTMWVPIYIIKEGISKESAVSSILTCDPAWCFYSVLGGWPGCGPSHHHLCEGEGHRLLQAFYDIGHQHPLPQTQWHQSRSILLPQPAVSWYLDVCAAGMPWCQLCAVCYCQVNCHLKRKVKQFDLVCRSCAENTLDKLY